MTSKGRILMVIGVLCSMFSGAVASDSPRDVSEDDLKVRRAPVDYSVAQPTTRMYDLAFGGRSGAATCALKVTMANDPPPATESKTAGDTISLTLAYSGFGFRPGESDKRLETTWKEIISEGEIETFEYQARIDRYGNVISSDLRTRLEPLLKSPRGATRRFAAKMLKPMTECTWLFIFPRIGPIEQGPVPTRDAKDWEAFGWPEFQKSVIEGGHATWLNVRTTPHGGGIILWANSTRQVASKEYGAGHDVNEAVKIDIRYDKKMRCTEKATVRWTTSFSDEESTVISFDAVLRGKTE
jgi:hypothetical protein